MEFRDVSAGNDHRGLEALEYVDFEVSTGADAAEVSHALARRQAGQAGGITNQSSALRIDVHGISGDRHILSRTDRRGKYSGRRYRNIAIRDDRTFQLGLGRHRDIRRRTQLCAEADGLRVRKDALAGIDPRTLDCAVFHREKRGVVKTAEDGFVDVLLYNRREDSVRAQDA